MKEMLGAGPATEIAYAFFVASSLASPASNLQPLTDSHFVIQLFEFSRAKRAFGGACSLLP